MLSCLAARADGLTSFLVFRPGPLLDHDPGNPRHEGAPQVERRVQGLPEQVSRQGHWSQARRRHPAQGLYTSHSLALSVLDTTLAVAGVA